MDMNEWLAGLNDPKNASTKPPRGVVPGKDVVFDDDRPEGFLICKIDIEPPALEDPKSNDGSPDATVHCDSDGLLA